jgi:regulator of ribonuclease activity A
MVSATADVSDGDEGRRLHLCTLELRQYGGLGACEGEVRTVRVVDDSLLVKQLVAEPGQGRVLVVDGAASRRVALFGESSARTAIANGWAGIVINGCLRDSAQLAALPLHLKALATCPVRSGKHGVGELDVPVLLGDLRVVSGDRIWSDGDGILVAPAGGA